jgi:hypothetical protein
MLSEWFKRIQKWAGRDLNSRPFGYQPNAPAKLSYRPLYGVNYYNSLIVFKDFQILFCIDNSSYVDERFLDFFLFFVAMICR